MPRDMVDALMNDNKYLSGIAMLRQVHIHSYYLTLLRSNDLD
jgi:hypothetical protein